jgi:hypothetical protein
MRKLSKFVSLALIGATSLGILGCSESATARIEKVEKAIEDAQTLSYDELVVKAKAEIGKKTFNVYGNSSALEKGLTAFSEATGIKYQNNQLGDAALYSKLVETIKGNIKGADMILAQDGNSLQTLLIDTGYGKTYVPKEYKDVLSADDKTPATATIYLNKIFMYNNKDGVSNYLTNVWQLAGTAADGSRHIQGISFKPGSTEMVNLNFLTMLTSDKWVGELKTAYKSYYGTDYVEETGYNNIGYKWIAEFIKNSVTHSSDTDIVKEVSKGASKSICLANYNKVKDVKAEDLPNLSYAAYENEGKGVEGFSGFTYKMYSLIARNAKYPYTAAAFINYITSEDGYKAAWGTNVGYYSANPNAPVATAKGDKELAYWKAHTVIEDPVWVAQATKDVQPFVMTQESK